MNAKIIKGVCVNLRIAEEKDAEFTLTIRQKDKNIEYMPKLNVSIQQQREWLKKQKASLDCYFFIVEKKNNEPIGTFSLYNISGKEGETGRLVLTGTQLESLEACVLFHDFCFNEAGMVKVYSEIEKENTAAIGLALKVGAKEAGELKNHETGRIIKKMIATKEDYYAKRDKLAKLINRFAQRENKQI